MKTTAHRFKDYERLIYFTLHQMNIPEPHDDYYQEAYFIFRKSMERYNPSRAKFSTFFVYTLTRHFQSFLRNEQRQFEASKHFTTLLPQEQDPLYEPLVLIDIHHHYKLTILERSVFQLAYNGFTVEETALLMKVSLSTIKRARRRIKQKVKARLSL